MSERDRFVNHVSELVDQVRAWVEPQEWVTKEYPKNMRDAGNQVYSIPALFLQKGPVRLLLDPVAYDVPGAEALVDLYLMPTYDDMASLYRRRGAWTIHYAGGSDAPPVAEARATPLDEESLNSVLESISSHAAPSF